MAEKTIVPVFPLNIVLFPGMEMPLHIFESRYRLMIDRCLARHVPFAINLIRSGPEVGGAAEPYATGTLAEISDVARLRDGRLHIRVTGIARMRVLDIIEGEPYVQARIELVPEPESPVPDNELARARSLFEAYSGVLLSMANIPVLARLPEDPAEASYAIASLLQTDLFTKQSLLEMPTARERLEHEAKLLEAEVTRLRAFSDDLGGHGYFYHRGRRISLN